MSSIPYMAPYNSTGAVDIDPATGLRRKKKTATNQVFAPPDGYAPAGVTYGTPAARGGGLGASATGTIPGSTPDYGSLIQADSLFKQLQAELASQGIGDAATKDEFLVRALSGFGRQFDQTQASQAFGADFVNRAGPGFADVLSKSNALAGQNTAAGVSTTARLDKSFQDRIRQIKNSLASRGLLQSGELGYQLGETQQARTQAEYDATQQLLDYLSQGVGQYTASERARQAALRQGLGEATDRTIATHPATGPQSATLVPGTSNIYVTANGTKYKRKDDGTFELFADGSPQARPDSAMQPHGSQWNKAL